MLVPYVSVLYREPMDLNQTYPVPGIDALNVSVLYREPMDLNDIYAR